MPPKVKKKTPKQLLAEAEARGATLTLELARREKELGDTISRLASNVTECKGLIIKQDEELARTFDAREVALRIQLADAKERIHRLEGEALQGREALAALDTHESERAQLQRQVAEAVGTREVMEKAHAAESYAQKQAIVSLRAQMEDKFKEHLALTREQVRRDLTREIGAGAASAMTEVLGLRALAAKHAREHASVVQVLEAKEVELTFLRRVVERRNMDLEKIHKSYAAEMESLKQVNASLRIQLGKSMAAVVLANGPATFASAGSFSSTSPTPAAAAAAAAAVDLAPSPSAPPPMPPLESKGGGYSPAAAAAAAALHSPLLHSTPALGPPSTIAQLDGGAASAAAAAPAPAAVFPSSHISRPTSAMPTRPRSAAPVAKPAPPPPVMEEELVAPVPLQQQQQQQQQHQHQQPYSLPFPSSSLAAQPEDAASAAPPAAPTPSPPPYTFTGGGGGGSGVAAMPLSPRNVFTIKRGSSASRASASASPPEQQEQEQQEQEQEQQEQQQQQAPPSPSAFSRPSSAAAPFSSPPLHRPPSASAAHSRPSSSPAPRSPLLPPGPSFLPPHHAPTPRTPPPTSPMLPVGSAAAAVGGLISPRARAAFGSLPPSPASTSVFRVATVGGLLANSALLRGGRGGGVGGASAAAREEEGQQQQQVAVHNLSFAVVPPVSSRR